MAVLEVCIYTSSACTTIQKPRSAKFVENLGIVPSSSLVPKERWLPSKKMSRQRMMKYTARVHPVHLLLGHEKVSLNRVCIIALQSINLTSYSQFLPFNILQCVCSRSLQLPCPWYLGCHELFRRRRRRKAVSGQRSECTNFWTHGGIMFPR